VGYVKKFLNAEKTEEKNSFEVYLSPGHSLESLLHASPSEQRLLSHGAEFRYNPFGERNSHFITGDKETAEEGVKVALEDLKKMEFYKKLTRLNQQFVEAHFKDRFQSPEKTWIRYFKSFFYGETKADPLTVKAFQEFVEREKNESEAWSYYYQFRNTPLASSIGWNVIAGASVLTRIDPRVIHCTPINIAVYYGGHRYLLHTITALTVLPPALHAVPSILIAYGINRVAESWLSTRQRPIESIR